MMLKVPSSSELEIEKLEAELLEEASEEDDTELLEELSSEEDEVEALVTLLGEDASFEEEGAASLLKEACSLEGKASLLSSKVDSSLVGALEKGMRSGVMLLQEASNATIDKVSRIKGVFFINKASFF